MKWKAVEGKCLALISGAAPAIDSRD